MRRKWRPVEAQLELVEAQIGLVERGAADPGGGPGCGLPVTTGSLRTDDPVASCVCQIHGSPARPDRFRG